MQIQCGKQSCFCNYKFIETTFGPWKVSYVKYNKCLFSLFSISHSVICKSFEYTRWWLSSSPHSINFVVNQMQILRFLCLSPTAICSCCCCCPIRCCCCCCCHCCVLWLIRIDQLFHQCHQYALLLIEFAACKNSWIFKWPTWGNSFLSLFWKGGGCCTGNAPGKIRQAWRQREIYQELA